MCMLYGVVCGLQFGCGLQSDTLLFHLQPGMMALCGATLYDRVDITGHPLQEDFQSGKWVGLYVSYIYIYI